MYDNNLTSNEIIEYWNLLDDVTQYQINFTIPLSLSMMSLSGSPFLRDAIVGGHALGTSG